ncbi:esterase/lipase superfamily enzyme [Litoreibacter ponti]|uniref:Esterase/lipase superfamily enzyme n=1 Tax=Litoreibacter ponti TaxID=1510457 RepID=A0A2T6BP79_9RHOB|nr:alpha/beta fold hydrolase [Litoreibacter ponti]PTX57871.1 esterase/lipase superfamily enzyme [Litoreibacter ponti]
MWRLAVLCLLVLAGCSFRGDLARVPAGLEASPNTRSIFFSTTRETDELPFGTDRRRGLTYGVADVSIPPIHEPGQIEWPRGEPDPAKHFLLARTDAFDGERELIAQINAALVGRKPGNREVAIFVHGFNTRFGDGLYRMAQMSYDLDIPGIAMHYSWPSAGNPLNYAYDRDSALFAREGLRRTVEAVAKSNASSVLLVAHSLGSMVTMETIRELRLSRKENVLRRIGGVILMSPDLDLDVFRSQADQIGKLPQPFIIFSSRRDRALRLVERLTGETKRLGKLEDVAEIAEYELTYIDITAFSEGGTNHFATAKSPALLKVLSRVEDLETSLSADGGQTGLLPGTVLTVRNTTALILSPAGL